MRALECAGAARLAVGVTDCDNHGRTPKNNFRDHRQISAMRSTLQSVRVH